jgi:hypothetical protein
MDYKEIEDTLEVPANTGIEGFLLAVKSIIKLGKVQNITIDVHGRISYKRYVREGETKEPLSVNFESLMPSSVIRNSKLTELTGLNANAAVAVAQLFNAATVDHLNPVALVGGPAAHFWRWYQASTGLTLTSREELFGVPFLTDRMIEDHVLILCAAYAKAGALIDTYKSYKIVIPKIEEAK